MKNERLHEICTAHHIQAILFSEGDVSKGGYEDTIWGNVREKFASMGLLPLEFTDCLQDSPYFRYSVFEKYLHSF